MAESCRGVQAYARGVLHGSRMLGPDGEVLPVLRDWRV